MLRALIISVFMLISIQAFGDDAALVPRLISYDKLTSLTPDQAIKYMNGVAAAFVKFEEGMDKEISDTESAALESLREQIATYLAMLPAATAEEAFDEPAALK